MVGPAIAAAGFALFAVLPADAGVRRLDSSPSRRPRHRHRRHRRSPDRRGPECRGPRGPGRRVRHQQRGRPRRGPPRDRGLRHRGGRRVPARARPADGRGPGLVRDPTHPRARTVEARRTAASAPARPNRRSAPSKRPSAAPWRNPFDTSAQSVPRSRRPRPFAEPAWRGDEAPGEGRSQTRAAERLETAATTAIAAASGAIQKSGVFRTERMAPVATHQMAGTIISSQRGRDFDMQKSPSVPTAVGSGASPSTSAARSPRPQRSATNGRPARANTERTKPRPLRRGRGPSEDAGGRGQRRSRGEAPPRSPKIHAKAGRGGVERRSSGRRETRWRPRARPPRAAPRSTARGRPALRRGASVPGSRRRARTRRSAPARSRRCRAR